MNSPTKSLLNPDLNFPVAVSIVRRTKTLLANGRTSTTTSTVKAKAIWVDLGWKEIRSQNGTRTAHVIEVHLPPKYKTLDPADDYFIKDGDKYRITSRLEMSRMSGSVMFYAERRDE